MLNQSLSPSHLDMKGIFSQNHHQSNTTETHLVIMIIALTTGLSNKWSLNICYNIQIMLKIIQQLQLFDMSENMKGVLSMHVQDCYTRSFLTLTKFLLLMVSTPPHPVEATLTIFQLSYTCPQHLSTFFIFSLSFNVEQTENSWPGLCVVNTRGNQQVYTHWRGFSNYATLFYISDTQQAAAMEEKNPM